MNQGDSLANRVAWLRRLQAGGGELTISRAEERFGDWPQHCQAFPSSYAQSRLWFLHQLEPDLSAYHLPALWRLSGDLDLNALSLALAGLVERHSTLRTSFCLQGSEVLQIIHPPAPFPLEAEALGDRSPDAVIEQWLELERSTPFDLTAGLLLRARLLAVDHQHHLLLLNHHHIASDGWSLSVLARDLTELYNAFRNGRRAELPPLSVHYQDYAAWQRERLSGDRLQTLKDYWIPQLQSLDPLELPTDHPRLATPSHQGGSVSFQIGAELLAPFEELCRSEGATLQMGLLALFALLLHRYSGQDDFAIGIPIWGRNHPDLEPLIGFFVNTLPIRTRFEPQQSFRQLLVQVKASSLAAYDQQELPFEQIVEALNPPRDTSRNPLVQVMLQLIELPESSLNNLDGLEVSQITTRSESSKVDLGLSFRRLHECTLGGKVSYSLDLFKEQRIKRLVEHLLVLLKEILSDYTEGAHTSVSKICILTEKERECLLSWSRRTTAPGLRPYLIHEFIKNKSASLGNKTAVLYKDSALSYGDLFANASSLARRMQELGLTPGDRVGVLLRRGLELPIAIIACLEAGGCYVPIDPDSTGDRINDIIIDSGAKILVTTQDVAGDYKGAALLLTIQCSGNKLSIEAAMDEAVEAIHNVPQHYRQGLTSNSLAYLIYTSGSTGKPKGVEVSHGAAVQMLDFRLRELTPSFACELSPIFGPISFDASIAQMLTPLAAGGCLLMLDNIAGLNQSQYTDKITCISGTPSSILEIILNGLLPPNISVIGLGAESLPLELANLLIDIQARLPSLEHLYSAYGLTEAGGFSAAYKLERSAFGKLPSNLNNIGRPISGASIYILDKELGLLPEGIPGELHIGGGGLARGYLNNPELTAELFIADPFSPDPTARLCKSGDLASWNSDGTLAFHGRLDEQIKLRGFRIEPGEIEAHLLAHPAVGQAVVVLRKDDPANPRLIAYWVPQEATRSTAVSDAAIASAGVPGAEQLRVFLAERLPEYMVPAAFVELEALPLTPNGKLDRKALPAPFSSGSVEQRVEPSTDLERQLHAIWTEVLGHGEFGISDNFFAIGGHSLAAVRLAWAVQELGLFLPMGRIFAAPTIAGLAAVVSEGPCPAAIPRLTRKSLPPGQA